MLERLFIFVVCMGLAGGVGWELAAWPGALTGVALFAVFRQMVSLLSAARILTWLRQSAEQELTDPPRVFGAWREVGDRMRRRLRLGRQRLDAGEDKLNSFLNAIHASPNGVMLLDAHGRIEWLNAASCQHFGLDAETDRMQHVANLVRDPAFAEYLNDTLSANVSPTRNPSTSPRVNAAGGATLLRWGKLHAVLKVQLHPYGEGQWLLLSQDFTAMAKADAMQRDFVANVSHEIRTPLTVLLGFIETLQTLDLDETERAKYLDLMAKQAARQQALINDLLTLSTLEGRARPGIEDEFEAGALLNECAVDARALSDRIHGEGKQSLHFHAPDDVFIVGNRSEWQSACSNLINNAIRYSGASGRVEASWALLPDGQAEFAVVDTGQGIAPEHLSRLSERFYRVDSSRSRESGGTGLGLAITRQVAQRHGGELIITSTLGQGSRFALRVPAARVRQKAACSE